MRLPRELEGALNLHRLWASGSPGGEQLKITKGSFPNTDFSLRNLQNSVLDGNFTGSNFSHAYLFKANLSRGVFDLSNFQEADLTEAVMVGASLDRIRAPGARFREASIKGSSFRKALLAECDFKEADLYRSNFSSSECSGSNFCKAGLQDTDFYESVLRDCNFDWANLHRIKATSALLSHSSLKEASLLDADLRNSHLDWADLENAYLVGCDLRGVDLSTTNLFRCRGTPIIDSKPESALWTYSLVAVPSNITRVVGYMTAPDQEETLEIGCRTWTIVDETGRRGQITIWPMGHGAISWEGKPSTWGRWDPEKLILNLSGEGPVSYLPDRAEVVE